MIGNKKIKLKLIITKKKVYSEVMYNRVCKIVLQKQININGGYVIVFNIK